MTNLSGARIGGSMLQCARNCGDCLRVCTETASHCIALGGRHADPRHLELLFDCADVCNLSVKLLARDSDFHMDLCSLCAQVCRQCARSCERIGEDEMMRECAEVCWRCAESCDRMARMAA